MKDPMDDGMTRELDDTVELFEQAHYTVPTYNSETGKVTISTQPNMVFTNVRKLKRRYPDYRPGKVKTYTEEEVREYVDRHKKI